MMTGVIIAPSLGGLLVGCMLLLTGAVPFLVIVPTVWGEVVVGGGVVSSGFDAVETKGITWHHGTIYKYIQSPIITSLLYCERT